MAATAHSRLAVSLLLFVGVAAAQENRPIHRQITQVATALTQGNAADALGPFDKSFAGYSQLRDDFSALTAAYRVGNELEIEDPEIEGSQATVTVHWILTLTGMDDSAAETRTEDITVKLTLRDAKWRITGFTPLSFFDPASRQKQK